MQGVAPPPPSPLPTPPPPTSSSSTHLHSPQRRVVAAGVFYFYFSKWLFPVTLMVFRGFSFIPPTAPSVQSHLYLIALFLAWIDGKKCEAGRSGREGIVQPERWPCLCWAPPQLWCWAIVWGGGKFFNTSCVWDVLCSTENPSWVSGVQFSWVQFIHIYLHAALARAMKRDCFKTTCAGEDKLQVFSSRFTFIFSSQFKKNYKKMCVWVSEMLQNLKIDQNLLTNISSW